MGFHFVTAQEQDGGRFNRLFEHLQWQWQVEREDALINEFRLSVVDGKGAVWVAPPKTTPAGALRLVNGNLDVGGAPGAPGYAELLGMHFQGPGLVGHDDWQWERSALEAAGGRAMGQYYLSAGEPASGQELEHGGMAAPRVNPVRRASPYEGIGGARARAPPMVSRGRYGKRCLLLGDDREVYGGAYFANLKENAHRAWVRDIFRSIYGMDAENSDAEGSFVVPLPSVENRRSNETAVPVPTLAHVSSKSFKSNLAPVPEVGAPVAQQRQSTGWMQRLSKHMPTPWRNSAPQGNKHKQLPNKGRPCDQTVRPNVLSEVKAMHKHKVEDQRPAAHQPRASAPATSPSAPGLVVTTGAGAPVPVSAASPQFVPPPDLVFLDPDQPLKQMANGAAVLARCDPDMALELEIDDFSNREISLARLGHAFSKFWDTLNSDLSLTFLPLGKKRTNWSFRSPFRRSSSEKQRGGGGVTTTGKTADVVAGGDKFDNSLPPTLHSRTKSTRTDCFLLKSIHSRAPEAGGC